MDVSGILTLGSLAGWVCVFLWLGITQSRSQRQIAELEIESWKNKQVKHAIALRGIVILLADVQGWQVQKMAEATIDRYWFASYRSAVRTHVTQGIPTKLVLYSTRGYDEIEVDLGVLGLKVGDVLYLQVEQVPMGIKGGGTYRAVLKVEQVYF